MEDNDNRANLIDCASNKSMRVIRLVLGAETCGLADACDSAIIIYHDLKQMLGKTLRIQFLTDSENIIQLHYKERPLLRRNVK